MPIVRLSGSVEGKKDPNRKIRAKLLYGLFNSGWDIYNGNGDQVVTLSNIQEKIIESDAFVFMPGAKVEDMFKAASIFVGFQTNDSELKGKSSVVMNSDNSWDSFLNLLSHLHKMGTIKEPIGKFLSLVNKPLEVVSVLESNYSEKQKTEKKEPDILKKGKVERKKSSKPDFNVCVFCSASIDKEDYLKEGLDLGVDIAKAGWGCISGAGKTGIMGMVVKGSAKGGGWSGGSNVPHIIEMEGLPDELDEFWPRGDIYTRMEVMIEESHAFIIMPGGMGTVQELLALVLLKQQENDLMKGKSIVVVNKQTENGGFWDPLLTMLEKEHSLSGLFHVVEKSTDAVKLIDKLR